MKLYLVTAPEHLRGIYDSWGECQAKVTGVVGARYQSVDSREKAEKMLAGGILLEPGTYAFTDGNALGGVGIVLLESEREGVHVHHELATNVFEVFAAGDVEGLESRQRVAIALASLHNILAELGGLHGTLALVARSTALTLVHDYKGVGAWMDGSWKTKDAITTSVIGACRNLVAERRLIVTYLYQRGHQKNWAGRDDYARWNGRADELATEGGKAS
jgi:ribonuclease H-related protein